MRTMDDLEAAVAAVWAELGPGRPEVAYSAALALATGGDHQYPVPVRFRGVVVSVTKADVFVTHSDVPMVIEVKLADRATREAMEQAHAYARSLGGTTTAVVVAFPKTSAAAPTIARGVAPKPV